MCHRWSVAALSAGCHCQLGVLSVLCVSVWSARGRSRRTLRCEYTGSGKASYASLTTLRSEMTDAYFNAKYAGETGDWADISLELSLSSPSRPPPPGL